MERQTITLLVDGRAAFPAIIGQIQKARRSLQINMFIWRDDRIGNQIAREVLAAADRGVEVRISVDRYGVVLEKCEESGASFFHKTQTLAEQIKILGLMWLYPENCGPGKVKDVETELYRRIATHPNITLSAHVFKADHSKYYIIDDEILFLGGINIEDKENGCDLSGRVYGDYMVMLRGGDYVRAFRRKLETGEDSLPGIAFGINRKEPKRHFEMEQRYLALINGAERELHITMAYFSPMKKFVDAILAAHRRGVRVTVLIPEKANFQNDSNRRTVRRLLKATGGQIGVYLSPKMLHTKLVVNESCSSLGSTNITKKAFSQLDELNLFLSRSDSAFEQTLTESIRRDLGQARRVRKYQQIRYNPLMAFLEGFLV